jgi:hypothetical protein
MILGSAPQRVVAVGFDSGDFVCIGAATPAEFVFSRVVGEARG